MFLWYDRTMNKKMSHFIFTTCFLFVMLATLLYPTTSDYPAILPLEKQAEVVNRWLKIRLDTVLPEVMRRENMDMWIIICREYNEDPVFLTLMPAPTFAARRTSILVFFDKGKEGIERLVISGHDMGDLYKAACTSPKIDQWQCLANVVSERNPKKIGINESDTFNFGDGLTASLKKKVVKAIGPKYALRLHSAQNVAVGWLEKRIQQELEVYPQIVAIARSIIKEAFSNRVITPGVTTTSDVMWWMREKINKLGLKPWFHPWVNFQRKGSSQSGYSESGIIKRGDLLHCDIGITYLRLNTDTQEMAYVLREGEKDVPEGLKKALMQGNQLQDIFTRQFKANKTGNEVLLSALKKANSVGLKAQIYTHPLGFHGHGAGPTIGLWDQQGGVPGQGDYPLYLDTCYAIELNIKAKIPEWSHQEVRIGLEQDALFSTAAQFKKQEVRYLSGRQITFHIIK
jgi:Metallopeptidase family M24